MRSDIKEKGIHYIHSNTIQTAKRRKPPKCPLTVEWINKMWSMYMKLKDVYSLDSILKSRDITWSTKVYLAKTMVFPVVMYGCENWTIKKAEFRRIDALELWCWRRLLSFLDCKEIQPAHPKGDQSWVFIGRTDVEAETPVLWPPDVKSWLMKRPWWWERLREGGEGDNRG